MMTASSIAAVLAAALIGLGVLFQLVLAAGAPLGHLAWGGRERVLSRGRRLASVGGAAVLALAGWIVLSRADLVSPGAEPRWIQVGAWLFAGFFLLNTAGNLASGSRVERALMTPITIVLTICFVVVARAGA